MTDQNPSTEFGDLPTPVVFERDGRARASSRDVANMFDKRHADVLRSIDGLVADAPGCQRSFAFTSEALEMPNGGFREGRVCHMDRDGFTLLAMGFTGSQALNFKIAYIEAFNAMESRLRGLADPMAVLADPQAMRGLLLSYSEKVLALQAENAELHVKGDALDRLATAEGSLCVTDAAKTLQVQPRALFMFLRSHRWIYTRTGGSDEVAYQDKLASGLLEHKTTTVHRSDGSEKVRTQVRVTPKGLARLAREFPSAVAAA